MDIDFSRLNCQYLLQIRDLARQAPDYASALLGLPGDLLQRIGRLTPEQILRVMDIPVPLMVPRCEPWWWERLAVALDGGRAAELEAVLAHAGLLAGQ